MFRLTLWFAMNDCCILADAAYGFGSFGCCIVIELFCDVMNVVCL